MVLDQAWPRMSEPSPRPDFGLVPPIRSATNPKPGRTVIWTKTSIGDDVGHHHDGIMEPVGRRHFLAQRRIETGYILEGDWNTGIMDRPLVDLPALCPRCPVMRHVKGIVVVEGQDQAASFSRTANASKVVTLFQRLDPRPPVSGGRPHPTSGLHPPVTAGDRGPSRQCSFCRTAEVR